MFGETDNVFYAEGLDHVHDRAQVVEPWPFVDRRDILDVKAVARHADTGDDEHALGLVEMLIDAAFDEAAVASHGDNLFVLDQLGRDLGRLLRFPGIVLDRITIGRPLMPPFLLTHLK